MPLPNHNDSHSIQFEHVSKRFGDVTALDDISLTIASEQTTAILGPSGCGKSTLLQLVNALQHPDNGAIRIDGQLLQQHDIQYLRRHMGYCVQHIGLFPHLTVKNNITLLARLENWSLAQIQARLETLLALTALDSSQLERYPHQLSGGQQQRAGLCRALMLKPDFLLLDEAFAAVDPITRIDIHQQFQQLQQQEQHTTLLVTHDIQEALTLADSIVVLKSGALVAHLIRDELNNNTANKVLLDLIRHGHE